MIQGGKELLVRSRGKEHFVEPGGKLKAAETAVQALIRELKEELRVDIEKADLDEFDTYYAPAAGQEDQQLRLDVFRVYNWHGEIIPDSEIEEILWVGAKLPPNIKVGSILQHHIHPRLVEEGVIK